MNFVDGSHRSFGAIPTEASVLHKYRLKRSFILNRWWPKRDHGEEAHL